MAVIAAAAYTLFVIRGGFPDYLGTLGPIGTQLLFFLLLTLPVGLYLYFTESSPRHATIGKQKAGLVVVSKNGDTPRKAQTALRTIVKLLPWEIAHTFVWQLQNVFYLHGYEADVPIWIFIGLIASMFLAVIYVAMVAFRRDGRGPHDIVAGTMVRTISG